MPWFKVQYSGTGRADCGDEDILKFKDKNEALDYAYNLACEDFHQYGGSHGFGMTLEEYQEENPEATEDEWHDFQNDTCESWIDYTVTLCDENTEELWSKILGEVQGTCQTLEHYLEYYGLSYVKMPIEFFKYIDGEIFLCDQCGWWFELSDEAESDQHERICISCKSD